jgi:hypothetical protein
MAEEAKAPRKRSQTWLWMLLSLVVVAGFLVWLGLESEPTSVAVVEEEDDDDDAGMPLDSGMVAVVKDSLAADKARYEGQRIRVDQVEATSPLGDRIFWGVLGDRSNQVPILIRLDSAAAQGFQMQRGGLYTITGELVRMADSLATVWGEGGEFAGEGEQAQAAFADYFIQASNIRPSRSPRSGSSGSAAPAGSGG